MNYTGSIACKTCGQDYEVIGVEEDAVPPGFTLCEHTDTHNNACYAPMCLACAKRCDFCREPRCAEHLRRTDCGLLCSKCEDELKQTYAEDAA